jgi:CubicO group peptidase (beta-lactamase class C family)
VRRAALLTALAVLTAGCGSASTNSTPPTDSSFAVAKRQGLSVPKLRAAERRLAATRELLSALVMRHGRLVLERYYHGATRDRPWSVYSVTKSVVSALVGIALRDGRLRNVDERLVDLFPDELTADADPLVRSITIRDLLTMSAGYRDVNTPNETDDWVRAELNRPVVSEPGAVFSYDDGSAHLLSCLLTRVTEMPAAEYARRELFRPLGIRPGRWNTDGQGHSIGSGGLFLRPRDMLRFGQLYLQDGRWRGRQIVPAAWVRDSTRQLITVPGGAGYGYLWWINTGPHGGFLAQGYRGQTIAVFPRSSVVIVLTGVGADPRPLLRLLLDALDA